jgi:DNA-binding FadR family transcriptional regulator
MKAKALQILEAARFIEVHSGIRADVFLRGSVANLKSAVFLAKRRAEWNPDALKALSKAERYLQQFIPTKAVKRRERKST